MLPFDVLCRVLTSRGTMVLFLWGCLFGVHGAFWWPTAALRWLGLGIAFHYCSPCVKNCGELLFHSFVGFLFFFLFLLRLRVWLP